MNSSDKPDKFVILTVSEMREKYYLKDERPPVLCLMASNVPATLHAVIHIAERWGISDDLLRADATQRASKDEIEYLKTVVNYFDDALDAWLAGPEASDPHPSKEYLAFSNMRMAADGC